MAWCPHCKTEYRAGYATCADCGAVLETAPPALPLHKQAAGIPPLSRPCLLTSIAQPEKLALLKDLLEQGKIAYRIQDDARGSYLRSYMGVCVYGQRIFVEEAQLEEANAILEAYGLPGGQTVPAAAQTEAPEPEITLPRFYQVRRGVMRFYILARTGLLLLAFLISLIALIAGLFKR